MIKTPFSFLNAPDGQHLVVETFIMENARTLADGLVADSMSQNWPSLAIAAGLLLIIFIALSRMRRRAQKTRFSAIDGGESFAASIDIPPYVDTSNLAAIAAQVDPEDAAERVAQIWSAAERKADAIPLYTPNASERLARDAVAIELVFCTGQLARRLAKLPAADFDRFAAAAETLGADDRAGMVRQGKSLAGRGHSAEMKALPRKGAEWSAFRKEIASFEAAFMAANTPNGRPGRLVALADAYFRQIAPQAA